MNAETFSSSALARLELWFNSFHAWLDAPVFGHGIGAFEQAYAPHRADQAGIIDQTILTVPWNAAGQAHNIILQNLIETGVIGAGLLGVLVWLIYRRGLSAALIAAPIMCLIEFPEQNPATAMMIVCALGLACQRKPS